MQKVASSSLPTNALFVLLLVFLALALYLFSGFLVPLLLALVFVVTTYPLFRRFTRLCFNNRILASFLFCLISFILFLGLIVFISWLLLGEVVNLKDIAINKLAVKVENWFNPNDWNTFISENTDKLEKVFKKIPFVNEETVTDLTKSALQEISGLMKNISTGAVNIVTGALGKIGGFFLGLLYFYLASLFFLIDGERVLERLLFLMPIKNKYVLEVEHRFTALFKSWIIGNITIMIAQGILAGIGFAIAGVPSPTIWGIIITFASLIPFIGTSVIFIPTVILLLIAGHYFSAIFLLTWGLVVVGTVDNFIRPVILKGGAHLPVLILFFALIGGLQMFGLKGLLFGPIIIVFFDSLLHIYGMEYEKVLKELDK